MSDDHKLILEAIGNARIRFWACPVEGHSFRHNGDGSPLPTVEWDGDVAYCLARGCGRMSDDPGRNECWCDGDYGDCNGACRGPGQCSCSPDHPAHGPLSGHATNGDQPTKGTHHA